MALDTVVVSPTGAHTGEGRAVAEPAVDCFYVYPSMSAESVRNADLRLQPAEKYAAIIQASRFSRVCRVFAPLYRQALGADGNGALA